MLTFLGILVFFISVTSSIVALSKRRFEEVLPFAAIVVVLILYVSGLFGGLDVGYKTVLIMAAVGGIALPVLLLTRVAEPQVFFRNFFSIGFFVFFVSSAFVYVIHTQHYFSQWDEFSHWRPFLAETLRLDALYSSKDAQILVHRNYPPFMTLVEYFWCRIQGGTDIEPMAFRALHTFSVMLVLPACRFFNWTGKVVRDALISLLLVFLTLTVPSMVIPLFDSVYIDACFGVLIGYTLAIPFLDRKWGWFSIFRFGSALSAVILSKGSGYLFVLIALAMFLCVQAAGLIRTGQPGLQVPRFKSSTAVKAVLTTFAVFISPWILNLAWQSKIAYVDLTQPGYLNFHNVNLSSVLAIFLRTAPPYQTATFKAFLQNVFTSPIVFSTIPLSFVRFLMLSFILLLALAFSEKQRNRIIRQFSIAFIVAAGGLAYAVVVGLGIVLTYGDGFAQTLNSWDRHVNVYSVAVTVFIFFLFVIKSVETFSRDNGGGRRLAAVGMAALVLLMPMDALYRQILPLTSPAEAKPMSQTYIAEASEVLKTVSDSDRLFIVATEINYILFKNAMLKIPSNAYGVQPKDSASWQEQLRVGGYNYVYLLDVSEAFKASFYNLFDRTSGIRPFSLYAISSGDDGLRLVPVT